MTQIEVDSGTGLIAGGTASRPGSVAGGILALGIGALALTLLGPQDGGAAPSMLVAGIALVILAVGLAARDILHRMRLRAIREATVLALSGDETPSILADRDGRILYANPAATERLRRGGERTLAHALGRVLADPSSLLQRLGGRIASERLVREEVVTRRGHIRIGAQRLDDGQVLWRVEDLGERNGRAGEAGGLPMLTAGPSGTILYMNEAFRRLTGGRSRSLEKVFLDLPIRSGGVQTVDTVDGPAETLVAEIAVSGGRREIYLLPVEAATAPAMAMCQSGWAAVEDLPVPLLRVSVSGEVLAANREARALLPLPVGPATRLSDLLEGLGRPLIDWVQDTVEGRAQPGPQVLRARGGMDTHLQVTLNLAGHGDDRHVIAVLNDVSELKSLEAQFVQSQKMQAIGQLAGGVAHDFNNLLTAISGHCDLLLLRHDQGDPDYGDLIQIHQNANRAASLVGQLLAFSRKQNLMPETLDLRDTLADLTHLLNRLVGERVTLTLNHDPVLAHVRADKRQLEQVIMNLVVNARDAMPAGGEIRVETENVDLATPLERDRAVVPPGRYVLVRVSDEGVGIPPDRLPKIFEPFYTSKRPGEGTGLGLSTAYGIVKQTGGYIFADSVVGEGTVFTLYFPSHDQPAPPPVPAARPPADLPSARAEGIVLLVEDEAPVRAFASRALRLRGYTVLEADSAEAALALLEDASLKIDLFVTDVIMPGKDGPTWVREALRDRPETRVVFVSGYAEETFAEHQGMIPNSVFLPKPFSLAELTETVRQQIAA